MKYAYYFEVIEIENYNFLEGQKVMQEDYQFSSFLASQNFAHFEGFVIHIYSVSTPLQNVSSHLI